MFGRHIISILFEILFDHYTNEEKIKIMNEFFNFELTPQIFELTEESLGTYISLNTIEPKTIRKKNGRKPRTQIFG